jgi:hypothetical protein
MTVSTIENITINFWGFIFVDFTLMPTLKVFRLTPHIALTIKYLQLLVHSYEEMVERKWYTNAHPPN